MTVATAKNLRQNATGRASAALPSVIVLNLFHSGLGIARQLAETSVRVVGLSSNSGIYGNFTRLCEVRRAPDSQEHPHDLVRFLLSMASEVGKAIIFPTRDADLVFLDRFRAELDPLYCLAIPEHHVLNRVMDKAALAKIATDAGIPCPRTAVVSDLSELIAESQNVGFPCIVKPVKSVHWREGNHWKTIGGRKAFRAENEIELERQYARIAQVRSEALLQEWIPGKTEDLVVWGGCVGRGQEPEAWFTARKLIQSPGEFGTGSVVASEPLPDLVEPSMRLCFALGYEGIAEIEYKRDPRDGTLKLIEMNPRHWDWHELGGSSQANITWAAYCRLTGRSAGPVRLPVRKAKWVAEDVLLRQVLASFWEHERVASKAWRAIAGERIYGMFAWNDPMPCIRYSLSTLVPALTAAGVRKIRQRLSSNGNNTRIN